MVKIWEEIIRLNNEGRDGVLITVIDKKGMGPSVVGKKMLIDREGNKTGSIGGGEMEFLAVKKAWELMNKQEHCIEIYNLSEDYSEDNSNNINMLCGGSITIFFEYLPVRPILYIMGMGHVGRCLLQIMSTLDWQIIGVDYRWEPRDIQAKSNIPVYNFREFIGRGAVTRGCFIVIAGYSHEEDYEVLEEIYRAKWQPIYIGLLASSKKSSFMVRNLIENIGSDIDLSVLRSPVGLDIGGKTPEEIALAIAAEIQSIRYEKKDNRHLSGDWTS